MRAEEEAKKAKQQQVEKAQLRKHEAKKAKQQEQEAAAAAADKAMCEAEKVQMKAKGAGEEQAEHEMGHSVVQAVKSSGTKQAKSPRVTAANSVARRRARQASKNSETGATRDPQQQLKDLQHQHQQSPPPTWLWALIVFAVLMLLKHSQKYA